MDHIQIDDPGILSATYKDGAKIDLCRIPLRSVVSLDNLTQFDGNV